MLVAEIHVFHLHSLYVDHLLRSCYVGVMARTACALYDGFIRRACAYRVPVFWGEA